MTYWAHWATDFPHIAMAVALTAGGYCTSWTATHRTPKPPDGPVTRALDKATGTPRCTTCDDRLPKSMWTHPRVPGVQLCGVCVIRERTLQEYTPLYPGDWAMWMDFDRIGP